MQKIVLILLLVFSCSQLSFSQSTIFLSASGDIVDEGSAFFKRDILDRGDSIKITQFYLSGKKFYDGYAKPRTERLGDVTFVGKVTFYHKNGKVSETRSYNIDGKLDGVVSKFYPDGSKESEVSYKNGAIE